MKLIKKALSFVPRPIFVKGQERYYQYLLAIIWGNGLLTNYIVVPSRSVIGDAADMMVPLAIILLSLLSLRYLLKVNNGYTWIVFFALSTLLFGTYVFGNQINVMGIERFGPQIVSSLPYILLGVGLKYRRDYSLLILVSWLNVISSVLYQFYFISTGRLVSHDMMGLAYSILPSIVICFLSAFQLNLLISWITGILGTFLLFVAGTRGAVVSLAGFLLLYSYLYEIRRGRHKIRFVIMICAVVLIATSYFTAFFDYTSQLGFGTRIYDQLMGNAELNGSGREQMYDVSINEILHQGFWGHGVFGEQYLYKSIIGTSTYPHNLILEILLQFGILIGVGLVFLVFYLPYKAYQTSIRRGDIQKALFVVGLVAPIYMNLLFSYTFWTSPLFFFVLSYSINAGSQSISTTNRRVLAN